jgi:hypothetical protein
LQSWKNKKTASFGRDKQTKKSLPAPQLLEAEKQNPFPQVQADKKQKLKN